MDEAPPPPPPPPPAPAEPAAVSLGLGDIGRAFIANATTVVSDAREAERARLKRLEVPLRASAAYDRNGAAPLDQLDWAHCSRLACSEGGSSGVFFADFSTNAPAPGKAVLKGSVEPAREVYMARVLRLSGISAPHVRAVSYSQLEYEKIKETVDTLMSGEAKHRAIKQLLRPQILVMEYVRGVSLLQMTPELASRFFDMTASPEQSRGVLHAIGRIMGADVVFNNWDRVPLVHGNEGNFGNIMLQPDSGHVLAIDNSMTSIKAVISGKRNTQYDKYLAGVAALCAQLAASGPHAECALVAQVRVKMADGTGLRLGTAEGLVLQAGIAEMLLRLADEESQRMLVEERQVVAGMVTAAQDWESVWSKDVAQLDVSFMRDVAQCLNQGGELARIWKAM